MATYKVNDGDVDLSSFFVVIDRSVELMIKHVIGTAKQCGVRLVKDLKTLDVEDLIKLDEMILSVKMRVDANVKLAKTYIKKSNNVRSKDVDDDLIEKEVKDPVKPIKKESERKASPEGTIAYYRAQGMTKPRAKEMARQFRVSKEPKVEAKAEIDGDLGGEAVCAEEVFETKASADVGTTEGKTEVDDKGVVEEDDPDDVPDDEFDKDKFELELLDEAVKAKDRRLDEIHHNEYLTDTEKADRRQLVFDELYDLRKKKRLLEAKKLVLETKAAAAGGVLELQKEAFDKYSAANTFVEDGNEVVVLGGKKFQRHSVARVVQDDLAKNFFDDAAAIHTSDGLSSNGLPSVAVRLPDGKLKAAPKDGLKHGLSTDLAKRILDDLIRDAVVDSVKTNKALNDGEKD